MSSGEERIYTLLVSHRRPAGWSSGHRVTEDCLEGYDGVCRRYSDLFSKQTKGGRTMY